MRAMKGLRCTIHATVRKTLSGTVRFGLAAAAALLASAPGVAQDATCVADSATLCLDGGRFGVRADWRTSDGASASARAVTLTPGSGYFWFFDPDNLEVAVKVLNGCPVNGRHWVFAAGLTNVEVTITVSDTVTGLSRTYTNPQGVSFESIRDTFAFATCE